MSAAALHAPVLGGSPVVRVRTEVRDGGIAVLTIDDPSAAHNTITPGLEAQVGAALDALESEERVSAIVIRSGKKESFLVGANIDLLRSVRFAKDAEDAARAVARRFEQIADGPKPVVACVHGAALGGGFELALACAGAVASDDPRTVFGLPEVRLGLIPAANGLLRIADRAGVRLAIDLGLSGRTLTANAACRHGLVDEIVAPSIVLDAAVAMAKRLARARLARRLPLGARLERALVFRNPIGRALFFRSARADGRLGAGGELPAPVRILDVLETHSAAGFSRAAALEARLFGELVVTDTAKRLIDVFLAERATKKESGLEPGEKARALPVDRLVVLGAGLMGAGIAAVSLKSGLTVRLKDRDDAAVGRGLRYVREHVDDCAFSRLSATTDYSGMRHADMVIEAVFEDIAVKQAVLREIEKLVAPTCVIATNASSIPIARIAEASSRPGMVLGMHYFSPVPRIGLVEIVRTKTTDPHAIATAVAVGRRQGKTVIVVRDGAGFYTTRILAPYLNEAAHLLADGASIDAIDDALLGWGFPQGPLHLLDEVGIDAAAHALGIAHAAYGERMRPSSIFAALEADHRRGRKNGRGFYLYGRGRSHEKLVDDTVLDVLGVLGGPPRSRGARTAVTKDQIVLRCTLALVNEALRCLDEGTIRSVTDGDIGAILGLGFPAFRGGPFRHLESIGAEEALRQTRVLEQRLGSRFEPAPLLVEMARRGRRLYA